MKRKAIYCWFILIFFNIFLFSPIIISVAYGDIVKGDVNGDGQVDLTDVVLAMQVLSLMSPSATIYRQAGGDQKIGLQDIIYIL